MLTAKIKEIGSEQHPYLTDSQGRTSFAPVRFFSEDEAMQYVEFSAARNAKEDDARQAIWPAIAQWE